MVQKNRNFKRLSLAFLSFFFLFSLSGCSSISNWFSSSDTAINLNILQEYDFKEFMTKVEPVYVDAESQYRLARHFQKQGRHEIAVEEFIKILKMDSEYYKAYNALGVSYDRLKKYDLAQDAYKAALKINPTLDYVYNNLGYSNLLKGNLQEAALAFEKAIVLNDKNKTYQNNLSLALAKLGPEYQPKTEIASIGKATFSLKTEVDGVENNFYAVQLGVFYNINNANKAFKKALLKGYDCPYIVKVDKEKPYYRIRFGKFNHKKDADSIASEIFGKNGGAAFTVTENYPLKIYRADLEQNCTDMAIKHPLVKEEFRVEISNGNGVDKMARKVGDYLSNKGYSVAKITNASHFNHSQTTIYYYPGFYEKARQLTEQIPGFENKGLLVESNQIRNNIKVIIGKDIIPYSEQFTKEKKNS
jgi:tetratricopeptide (TPR) repeat protein